MSRTRLLTSVVIPARHAAATLPRCLAALASSVRRPDEVIVVVDGPDDQSTEAAARAGGARVLVLTANLGPGGARNAGTREASGQLIAFVDADVAVRPEALLALFGALEHEENLAAAFGSYDDEPPAPGLASQYKNLVHHYVHQSGREEAQTFWAGLGAVRREVFEAVGGFDAALYPRPSIEDIELGERLRASGQRIALVKGAQGTHLKRWTLPGLLRTDLLDRAVPWTELILRSGRLPDDLNLGGRHRAGLAATWLLGLTILASPLWPPLLLVALASLAVALAASRDVLAFLSRKRGPVFAARAAPLHLLYFGLSGLGFGLGLARFLFGRAQARGPTRVLRNTLALGAGEIGARALSFLATVHVVRALGTVGFGRVEFAAAVVLYASALASFGLDTVGTFRAAADPRRAFPMARAVIALRLELATLSVCVLMLLAALVPRLAEVRTLLLVGGLGVFAEALSTAFVFQGLEQMRRVALVKIAGQGLYAVGVLALVHGPLHELRVPALAAGSTALGSLILGIVVLRALSSGAPAAEPGIYRSLLAEAAPLALNAALSLVVYNADVVILGFLADDRHVGLYRAAGRIVGVFAMLGAAFSSAVVPAMAQAAAQPRRFERVLRWSLGASAAAWVVGGSTAVILAPQLLRLTFGEPYEESVLVLRVLLVAAAVVGVRAQYRNALVALGRSGRNIPPTLAAAVVNVVFNFALIPRYGLRGAAAATIAAETVMLILVKLEVDGALARRA